MSMIMVHRPRYRQDKQQPERDQNCEQYIDEVLAIIYDDDYFDTRLSKTSRIAAIKINMGALCGVTVSVSK